MTHDYYLTWSADANNGLGWNVYPWASLPEPKPNAPPLTPLPFNNLIFVPIPAPGVLPASGSFRLTWSSDVRDGLGWNVYLKE